MTFEEDPVEILEEIIALAKKYLPEEQIKIIRQAYEFAKVAHEGQFRKSGEPYILHPVQVAGILVELKLDYATICAGFLHDVVEDTDYTVEDMENITSRKS